MQACARPVTALSLRGNRRLYGAVTRVYGRSAVDFRLLGPLEVLDDDGRELSVGTGRQRALLALLVLRANELVPSDRLVDELWGESAPPTAHRMVLNQVSALRRVLGRDGRIETRGSAYCLQIAEGERDVDRFEALLERGRSRTEVSDPEGAAAALREALSLWRGPALADLAYESFAQTEIARLEQRRMAAFEERVDAELALGRHADLVPELDAAVAEHPLRERLHAQLMLALYRCGRQAEALEVYVRARQTLVEEVGVEPGPELRARHAAVLAQDPALELPPDERELPPGLEGGSPLLAGRNEELAELQTWLAEAREGHGGLVLLSGRRGIGKTRLAAELASAALQTGVEVVYLGAAVPADDALAAARRVAATERPVLLVLDDAADAGPGVLTAVAEVARGAEARRLLVLVLHQQPDVPPAFAGLDARSMELGPLTAEAISEIARLYLPDEDTAIPAQVLVAKSDGVPLEAHRAASEWAQQEAAERLVASATRTETERGDVRSAEAELADDLIDLQQARERGRLYTLGELEAELGDDEPPDPAVCPFLGLATFDAAHADYFFGRERLVAELLARLVGSPLLAVVGPSGSGKSSVVRAGLLPALSEGALPGSGRWRQVVVRPGEQPLHELEAALRRTVPGAVTRDGELAGLLAAIPPGERLVLTVDQFEEVFIACQDDAQRAKFLDLLAELADDRDGRVPVVLAMRADFYGRCASHERLADMVGANQVLVKPMRRDELRRAIELPARRVGLRVEPALADALLADTLGEPGGLPLLSTALLELWQERDGRVLRRSAYDRTGGVRGAVARLAESTYSRLDEPKREAARRILLRLSDATEQAAFVRRRVPREELDLDRDEDAAAALATLTERRLVSVDQGAVEVAHEALLREWPRLRRWLDEDAEGRRLHQHLIQAARDWDAGGRDPGELYRGARLASTLDWAGHHERELNQVEREFVADSRAYAELEAERQRRTNRRLRGLLAGLGVLLALALAAGVVALEQRGTARDEAVAAEAQRLGAQALSEDTLDRSLLLARQGMALDDSLTTRGNLLAALLRSPAAIHVLRGSGGRMLAVGVAPSGRVVVSGDNRGGVVEFDTSGWRRGASYDTGLPVRTLRFSPDGTRLAIASGNESAGELDLLDVASFHRIARRRLGPGPQAFHALAFSPDSRVLVTGYAGWNDEQGRPKPGVLARLDARTGRSLGPATPVTRAGEDFMLAFAAGGKRLVMMSEESRQTVVRDADTLRPIRRMRAWGLPWASAVSPDGRVAALARDDGSLRLVDLRTGKSRTLPGGHDGSVQGAAFSADGNTLITVGDDAKAIVWDVRGRRPRATFEGHGGRIAGVALTPVARTAYTASFDGTVIAWDVAGSRRLGQPFAAAPQGRVRTISETGLGPVTPASYNLSVSPDGDTIAIVQPVPGFVNLIDSRTLRLRGRIRAPNAAAATIAPDGRTIAITGGDGSLRFWDIRALAPLSRVLHAGEGPSFSPRFTPDGRLLITHGQDWALRVWDTRRHTVVRKLQLRQNTSDPDVRPDGKVLAIGVCTGGVGPCSPPQGGPDGPTAQGKDGVEILSLPSLKRVARIPMRSARWSSFSEDGRLLVVGNHEGRAQLYDGHTFRPVGRPLLGHAGFLVTADFSPDGRTLATSSSDGTVRLWDTSSSRPIGTPLPGIPNVQVGVAFIRGGTHIATVYDSGQGYAWDVTPSSWAHFACAVAGRTLTRAEWQEALPGRDYSPACAP
jgi:DNA-binding SARP family transcriptional activator/WD40 repeat protein